MDQLTDKVEHFISISSGATHLKLITEDTDTNFSAESANEENIKNHSLPFLTKNRTHTQIKGGSGWEESKNSKPQQPTVNSKHR